MAGDPLMDIANYPQWVGDVVDRVSGLKRDVVGHPIFALMRDGAIERRQARAFLLNGWPVVEQFPQYMAMNLTKLSLGRSHGEDLARRFLTRNLRVEQNHADYWADWAAAYSLTIQDLNAGDQSADALALSHWCWRCSHADSLEIGVAATNYAIEGATGEWSQLVCSTGRYAMGFPQASRKSSMRWLNLHAKYDDAHPWEALRIIASLLGGHPAAGAVRAVERGIALSYRYFRMSLDACL